MRAGIETILARVVSMFGEAQPHHAYLFANRRANRLKMLVHDGYGIWLANRRLNQGRFSQLHCMLVSKFLPLDVSGNKASTALNSNAV